MLKMTATQLFAPFVNGGEVARLAGPPSRATFAVAETFIILEERGETEFFVVWLNPYSRGDTSRSHCLHVLNYHVQGLALYLDTDDGIWMVRPPREVAAEILAASRRERELDPQAALLYEKAIVDGIALARELLPFTVPAEASKSNP